MEPGDNLARIVDAAPGDALSCIAAAVPSHTHEARKGIPIDETGRRADDALRNGLVEHSTPTVSIWRLVSMANSSALRKMAASATARPHSCFTIP